MAYYDEEDLDRFQEISRERPELFTAFMHWYDAVLQEGALTKREKALIGLAVAHAIPCPYCIDSYTQTCLDAGSNMEQMTEAIHVAAAIRGGATLIHGLQARRVVEKLSL